MNSVLRYIAAFYQALFAIVLMLAGLSPAIAQYACTDPNQNPASQIAMGYCAPIQIAELRYHDIPTSGHDPRESYDPKFETAEQTVLYWAAREGLNVISMSQSSAGDPMGAWGVELVRNNIAWILKIRNSDGSVSDRLHVISSFKTASCPKGFGFPTPAGWVPSEGAFGNATLDNACFTTALPANKVSLKMCQAGSATPFPIIPSTGEKYRSEDDFIDRGPAPLNFSRVYRSEWGMDTSRPNGVLGKAWAHGHAWSLGTTAAPTFAAVSIVNPEGVVRSFFRTIGSTTWTALDGAGTLMQNSDGSWVYRKADDDATLNFTSDGKLGIFTSRNGWATTYTCNAAGQLSTIANGFGRSLSLAYNGAGKLSSVTLPDLRVIAYSYDSADRLSMVTFPDGKTRGFYYENPAFPHALTGLQDESGARFATFAYDSQGRAIDSALAGSVNRYQAVYPSSYSATVTDPLGTARTYTYETRGGELNIGQSSLPSENGGSDAASRRLGTAGLIESETDFKGVKTSITWDTIRRLPLSVERASGKPEALSTTTQWHPAFRLPVQVTGGGLSTGYTYDNVGNLLSRTVTDNLASRSSSWSWTYNAQHLIVTATEPNGAVTSYTYDTRGNVLTSNNALGHVTQYGYDLANRVVSSTTPNGLVTTYTYDQRDRVLTQTVGGQTTVLTYKPYGTVETVSLPSGLVLTYTYDAAHRLTGWSNNRGESGTYTLDGMGNRTAEQIKDAAGNVAWSVVRAFNNINRLSAETEGPNQARTFGYDANGELSAATNGLNQSTLYTLDNLRRVQLVTDAANASATLSYNRFGKLSNVTDFNGVSNTLIRDGRDNVEKERSADVGEIVTLFDDVSLPRQVTDALGQATTITRDALGRPTGLVFADGKTTTLRYDLTANSKGYLSEIIDRSGTTEYTRDTFGRVTLKKQTLANGSVQPVSYAYDPNGTLASIGYPNGGTLSYSYDSTGRLTGLNWNGNPLVSGIAWNPLGQPTAWTWAFTSGNPKLAANRSYDTAGRLTSTEFSSYGYDAAGRITSLTQNLYLPGDTDPTHSTIANANVTWSVGYNSVGRITSFNATGNTAGFGYDANGNRSSSTRVLNGQTTNRTYTVGSSSNQLTGFTQTLNGSSSTSVTYGYNANGDLLTDGLRSYTYDAEGRLAAATTGATDVSPTTRYAHNALGQRVFKTEPLYPPTQGDEADPGFMASLIAFFTKLWSPSTTQAEQLGYAYTYDEQGTLIAEMGSGGTNSAGQSQYIYLPTGKGPMPIAAVIDGTTYAVHSDHLNTPRKLSNADGQAVWQWGYSAFGEDKPTTARNRFANAEITPNPGTTNISEVKFNLRYPGQYADEESGLFYNYFRSYDARTGRYSQPDPIGLEGGWNRFGYVAGNSLSYADPFGLQFSITAPALASIARPSVGASAGAGAGTSGLGTLVDPLIGPIEEPPEPPDKDKVARCERMRKKIENLKKEVFEKRIPDLASNSTRANPLPYRIGPGEQLRDTVRGHEKLLNRQWRTLNRLEDEYARDCPC